MSDRLTLLALKALEEAALHAKDGPVKRTWALRFSLAYLADKCEDKDFFNLFWKDLVYPNSMARTQSLNASLNGIYRVLALRR